MKTEINNYLRTICKNPSPLGELEGSIFEDSKIPMKIWLFIIFQMCSAKKGVSAVQIQRMTGLSYKAAWFACHRIREAMKQQPLLGKLGGIVEVDETYVGGKRKNKLKKQGKPGRGAVDKVQVSTLVERVSTAE